jgi:hypothetical protein
VVAGDVEQWNVWLGCERVPGARAMNQAAAGLSALVGRHWVAKICIT